MSPLLGVGLSEVGGFDTGGGVGGLDSGFGCDGVYYGGDYGGDYGEEGGF